MSIFHYARGFLKFFWICSILFRSTRFTLIEAMKSIITTRIIQLSTSITQLNFPYIAKAYREKYTVNRRESKQNEDKYNNR